MGGAEGDRNHQVSTDSANDSLREYSLIHDTASNGNLMPDYLADQQENDRREREEIRIAHLPTNEQENAIMAEALRQAQYTHPTINNS